LWLLVGILVQYAIIMAAGESLAGGVARLLLLGVLVVLAAAGWPRSRRWIRRSLIVVGATVIAAGIGAAVLSSAPVRHVVIGSASALLTLAVLASLGWSLYDRRVIDRTTVAGVLCGYLLAALLFASLHELFGALTPNYLAGTSDPAPTAVLLYFSLITITTVGYGDVSPGVDLCRAVAAMEALIGQLYLVSVVAAAISRSWGRPDPQPRQVPGGRGHTVTEPGESRPPTA